MSNSPYEPPQHSSTTPDVPGKADKEKLRRVARYQRWVLFAVLGNVIITVAFGFLRDPSLPVALAMLAVVLGVAAFAMTSIFLLSNELMGTGLAVLCTIAMCVPCVSLIVLLVINQNATSFLNSNGVAVGFLGTSPDKI